MDFSAGDGFYSGGQSFTGRVDRVGAHRVTHVIDEMNNEKRSDRRESRSFGLRDHVHRRRIS